MKKTISLIKISLTQNMNIFKINTKNQSKTKNLTLTIILAILFMFSIWTYANALMDPLKFMGAESVLLTLFVGFASIITIVEGVYKSKNLLFNR